MAARRPSAYPPPVKVGEFVQAPEAEEDERIDVGVVFVGAGPAGLAGAIRLGQLLAEDPATAERLGETPIAVLDKGRVAGAHLLSGAVVNPSALRDLLPGEDVAALPGCFGPVTKEAVYLMSKSFEVRIPTPPPFHNKGNLVFSLSQLGRHMAELAEELGAMVLPETDAQRLLVADGAVRGVKTGDKGLGREGEPLGSYEPGVEVHAQATVLSEGTQGHLAGAAMERFGLRGRVPAGVEPGREGGVAGGEAARPCDPHAGLAVPDDAEGSRDRRQLHLPDGAGHGGDRAGAGAGLPRLDAVGARFAAAVQDASDGAAAAGGRRADRMGCEDDPGGRVPGAAVEPVDAGRGADGRQRRVRERAQAEGDPLRDAVGDAGGGGDLRAAEGGAGSGGAGRAGGVRPAGAVEPHLERPQEGAGTCARRWARGLRWADRSAG